MRQARRTFAARKPVAMHGRTARAPHAPGRVLDRREAAVARPNAVPGGRGAPLPSAQRRQFERFFGKSLADVRLHRDAAAGATARALRARAFTIGNDIVLGSKAAHVDLAQSTRLLAHEIAHVVAHSGRSDKIHRAVDDELPCGIGAGDHQQVQTGSSGVDVADAQCMLNRASARMQEAGEARLAGTPLDVDAVFGARTRAAVVEFQRHVFPVTPIEWDGIVGQKTWAALEATATGERPPPALCPIARDRGPFDTAFQDDVPGFEPCDEKTATARPPPALKLLVADPRGPVTAEATGSITPHLHLGLKVPAGTAGATGPPGECPARANSGAEYSARADGVAGTGGELFYSQVIRRSERTVRIGTETATETVQDKLDGAKIYRGTTVPASDLPNSICEGDTPGLSDSRAKDVGQRSTRVSFHLHDEFELFLMWRPSPDAPEDKWLSYDSVKWSWDAVATGVTNDSSLPWIGPDESFDTCGTPNLVKGSAPAGAKPKPASHLGLAINGPGGARAALASTLKDRVAKDKSTEPGC